jgi:heterodisulfide reductase subunit A
MCSGRVAEKFVLRAFENGAAAVLVAGCHLGDCHYIDANYQTEKRVNKLWDKLENLGINKNRLQLAWISAAEGEKFATKAKDMSEIIKKVTKDEIKKTVKILKEERLKQEEKMKRLAEKRAARKTEEGAQKENDQSEVAVDG